MSLPPNILHFSWHDTGRHFGCYGVPTVHTPSIDELARTGVRMNSALACATVSSPSRGACMTGRYPQSNGLRYLCHGQFGYRFNPGEKHLVHLLKERGYYTALHGFQHEVKIRFAGHDRYEGLEWFGFDSIENALPAPPIYPIPPCSVVAEGAARFLTSAAAHRRPFYLQLGFFETHRPYDFGACQPDDTLGITVPPYILDNPAARSDHAALQGSIRQADRQAGVVLRALAEAGLADNTIVIFTPDHGLANPRAKATLYRPGLEIAMIWRWPAGGIAGGRVSESLMSNVDVVPTLFDLLGWERPANFQGVSQASPLHGAETKAAREYAFAMHEDGDVRAVYSKRYALIRNFTKLRECQPPVDITEGSHPILQRPSGQRDVPPIEFYDLEADPLQIRNLHPAQTDGEAFVKHNEALWRWMRETNDPLLTGVIGRPRLNECLALLPAG